MKLEPIEIVNGVFTLIFVVISIIVGLMIISKYPKFKQRIFLLVGFTWIGLTEAWCATVISFLYVLATGEMITTQAYLLIGMTFIPITIFIWLIAFTDLVYKKKQKEILIIYGIYGALFEIFFLYFIFTDVSVLGELSRPVDIEYRLLPRIFLISIILISLITGILFSRESLKSENPEVRLKGKLLLIAFIFFVVGAALDTIITDNVVALLITRMILILSSIAFYWGFILPDWMKNLFLKQE